MDGISKIIFKDVVCYGKTRDENELKERYYKKYPDLTGGLKYIKNLREIKYVTIFENNYEGFELLKNTKQIIIIIKYNRNMQIKKMMDRRINKLKKINKKVNIITEVEIGFDGGGLQSLIAYGEMYRTKALVEINPRKIKKSKNEDNNKYTQKNSEKNKIKKNANNFKYSGR